MPEPVTNFPTDFPTVQWGESRATFVPLDAPLPEGKTVAALTFALESEHFALADIAGRGWCIPGGRIEAGETTEQAARREAWEEIGATLGPLRLLGHCVLFDAIAPPESSSPAPVPETPARLIAMYHADVLSRADIPPGSESQGVRLARYEDLPDCYFTWDALMAAMFHYARGMVQKQNPISKTPHTFPRV